MKELERQQKEVMIWNCMLITYIGHGLMIILLYVLEIGNSSWKLSSAVGQRYSEDCRGIQGISFCNDCRCLLHMNVYRLITMSYCLENLVDMILRFWN